MLLQDDGRRGDGVLRGSFGEEVVELSVVRRGRGTPATTPVEIETAKSIRSRQRSDPAAHVHSQRERTHRGAFGEAFRRLGGATDSLA